MIFNNEEYYPNPGFRPSGPMDILHIKNHPFWPDSIRECCQGIMGATARTFDKDYSEIDFFWKPDDINKWLKAPKDNPLPDGVRVETRIYLCGFWNYRLNPRNCEKVFWTDIYQMEYRIIKRTLKPILRLVK